LLCGLLGRTPARGNNRGLCLGRLKLLSVLLGIVLVVEEPVHRRGPVEGALVPSQLLLLIDILALEVGARDARRHPEVTVAVGFPLE
jgi:hypothetical protein